MALGSTLAPKLSWNCGDVSLVLVLGDTACNSATPSGGIGGVLSALLGAKLGVLEFLSSYAVIKAALLDGPPGGCNCQLLVPLGTGGACSNDPADSRCSDRADLERERYVPSASWLRLRSY